MHTGHITLKYGTKTNKYLLFQSSCGSGIQEGLRGQWFWFQTLCEMVISRPDWAARIHFQADSWLLTNFGSKWAIELRVSVPGHVMGPLPVAVDSVVTCFPQCKISREGDH